MNCCFMLLILQKMTDVIVYMLVKIIPHFQTFLTIQFMKGNLQNPFAVCPDQASIPDPSPVIALNHLFLIPDQMHIKGLISKAAIQRTQKPAQAVICFNVLIRVLETVLTQRPGLALVPYGVVGNVSACPGK